jgi:hypothetical protein
MQITITNCRQAPTWELLQEVIQQVTRSNGKLTSIDRVDRGVNYRAPGEYQCGYKSDGTTIPIKLSIVGNRTKAEADKINMDICEALGLDYMTDEQLAC